MAEEGNTVIAVDKVSGAVLGGFLCEDFCNTDPPGFKAFLGQADGNWAPVLTMIEELETKLISLYSIPAEREAGKWFHLWMLGVAPEGRGRSIAKKLTRHSIEWARARGFVIAFAETTGAASTHIMSAHGKVVAFVDYGKWERGGSEAVRALPAKGHPGMSMMVADLQSTT